MKSENGCKYREKNYTVEASKAEKKIIQLIYDGFYIVS